MQPDGQPTAAMTMEALVKHTNVIVSVVAENLELRGRLERVNSVLRQQQDTINELRVCLGNQEEADAPVDETQGKQAPEEGEGREVLNGN